MRLWPLLESEPAVGRFSIIDVMTLDAKIRMWRIGSQRLRAGMNMGTSNVWPPLWQLLQHLAHTSCPHRPEEGWPICKDCAELQWATAGPMRGSLLLDYCADVETRKRIDTALDVTAARLSVHVLPQRLRMAGSAAADAWEAWAAGSCTGPLPERGTAAQKVLRAGLAGLTGKQEMAAQSILAAGPPTGSRTGAALVYAVKCADRPERVYREVLKTFGECTGHWGCAFTHSAREAFDQVTAI